MHLRSTILGLGCAITCLGVAGLAWGDGVHIGRSPQGKLMVEVEGIFIHPILLSPILPGGLFNGWSGNNPGFTDTLDPDVGPDVLPLQPGAQIVLEVVLFDPAFEMIDGSFQVLVNPGDETFIGDLGFDTHPLYLINADDPLFDPNQTTWEATFILRDDGSTGYAPSDPVTLRFINRPAPADFNTDGFVNLTDYSALESCLTPPNGLVPGTCLQADIDHDGDVDLADFARFQNAFTGG